MSRDATSKHIAAAPARAIPTAPNDFPRSSLSKNLARLRVALFSAAFVMGLTGLGLDAVASPPAPEPIRPIVVSTFPLADCSSEAREAFDWLIADLTKSRGEHQQWVDYLEKNGSMQIPWTLNASIGTAEQQRGFVAQYTRRIASVQLLASDCGW